MIEAMREPTMRQLSVDELESVSGACPCDGKKVTSGCPPISTSVEKGVTHVVWCS